MPLDIVEYLILVQKFICYGAPRGHMAPSVNLPLPNISESTWGRKLKLKTIRYDKVLALGINFFLLGDVQGVQHSLM